MSRVSELHDGYVWSINQAIASDVNGLAAELAESYEHEAGLAPAGPNAASPTSRQAPPTPPAGRGGAARERLASINGYLTNVVRPRSEFAAQAVGCSTTLV